MQSKRHSAPLELKAKANAKVKYSFYLRARERVYMYVHLLNASLRKKRLSFAFVVEK